MWYIFFFVNLTKLKDYILHCLNYFNNFKKFVFQFTNFHSLRFPSSSRKITIHWCKEPSFFKSEPPAQKNVRDYAKTYKSKSSLYLENTAKSNAQANILNNDMNELKYNSNMLTALASFPGSGNTWLRYLLQQATGKNEQSLFIPYSI